MSADTHTEQSESGVRGQRGIWGGKLMENKVVELIILRAIPSVSI